MTKITNNPPILYKLTESRDELPRIDDTALFRTLQKGGVDPKIVNKLLYNALDHLTSADLKQQQASLTWMKHYIDIVRSDTTAFKKEIDFLINACGDVFSKHLHRGAYIDDLHALPIWITYSLNREHYDRHTIPNYHRRPKHKTEKVHLRAPLLEASLFLQSKIMDLHYQNNLTKNNKSNTEDISNDRIYGRSFSKSELKLTSLIYPLFDEDHCINLVDRQKCTLIDIIHHKQSNSIFCDDRLISRSPLHYFNDPIMIRYHLDRIVRKQTIDQIMSSDTWKANAIYSMSWIRGFLSSRIESFNTCDEPLQVFLATCGHYHNLFYKELLSIDGLQFDHNDNNSLEITHKNLIGDYSPDLASSPLMLWYSLFIEFDIFRGENKESHEALKMAIYDSGLEEVFLDEHGDFLPQYTIECLVNGLAKSERDLVFSLGEESKETDEDSVEYDWETKLSG